ncbi:MAG: hypothetical protein Q9204_005793, partial [Flavoplaca sp. TL-2023a]
RAAALRPYDKQMWQALGACYEKIERPVQAIKAYKRALVAGMAYIEPAASSSFGSSIASSGEFNTNVFLDPELLFPIALLHEKLNEFEEAAAYMELVLAQEEGPGSVHPDEISQVAEAGGDPVAGGGGGGGGAADTVASGEAGDIGGTGVTVTTSRARMWLARWAFSKGELKRAMEFATELCEDGFEVEEAKALVRDLRARMESLGK